jgi:thiamine pyrophosphokinase
MNAASRKARQILRNRRRANQKRTITTHVAKTTTDTATAKAVTAALRKTARTLRQAGQLGKVQTRISHVTATVVGPVYRYTAAQIALIAAAYRPRKAEYKAVAARLALAA